MPVICTRVAKKAPIKAAGTMAIATAPYSVTSSLAMLVASASTMPTMPHHVPRLAVS